jgi:hypothetical protein
MLAYIGSPQPKLRAGRAAQLAPLAPAREGLLGPRPHQGTLLPGAPRGFA